MSERIYQLQTRLSELNRKLSQEKDQEKRKKIQLDIEIVKNDIKTQQLRKQKRGI